jgi:PAS domain S-box-containing protein
MNKGTGIGFDVLFSNASMGIIVINEPGKIVLANPFLLKQFQYEEAELLGEPIEKLIPSRFQHKHQHHVQEYNKHPRSRTMGEGMHLFAIRKDGSEFSVEVSLGYYQSDAGKYVIGFVSDVSEKKKAEKDLRLLNEELEQKIDERTMTLTATVKRLAQLNKETEAKDKELRRINTFLNSIWEHAEAIIFVTDTNGIIKMFNPTAERQLGYSASEIVDLQTPLIFLPEQQILPKKQKPGKDGTAPAKAFKALTSQTDLGLPNEHEYIYTRKDGSQFPVSLTLNAMRHDPKEIDGYLGIAIDISERKKAEHELLLALEREKELGELKSRFVSMASHEFRTPLSTVLSSAYLISKYSEKEDHGKREKHVQRIVSSVNMLTDILNDFLSVGKIEEGKIQVRFSNFDFPVHIGNIIQEINGLFKKGQHINYHHEGNEMVTLDQGLLKHIVMNLLSNAVKFSPENACIEISSKQEKQSLKLTIKDNGLGISEEDQQHLFERFYRGSNVTHIQGTGLGLHIVSKYAELMNGAIFCRSKLNEGTTFTITFDLNQHKSANHAKDFAY